MKRKVILYIAVSIDGFIADTQGGIDFLGEVTVDKPVSDDSYERFYETIDTVVMGRTTYQQVVEELSPDHYPYEGAKSYVLTTQQHLKAKEGVQFVNASVVSLIERLLAEEGGNIWLVGGASLIAPLIKADLIDEYNLTTVPVILGQGISLFEGNSTKRQLKLKEITAVNGMSSQVYTR